MQRVKRWVRWLGELRYGQDMPRSTQRALGTAGVVALVVLVIISAGLYLIPFGKSEYTAVVAEADSIQNGDDVRIAGISVGKVKSRELTDDSVEVKFTVNSNVFVGDKTSMEIRMLTPVGGHYVALAPAGDEPLGDTPIPAERIQLPYSLMRALQDSQRPIAAVDAKTIQQTMDELTTSLQRSPQTVDGLSKGLVTLVGLIDRQNQDVSKTLNVADEYIKLLSDSRKVVGTMLTKLGEIETQILGRRDDIIDVLTQLTQLLSRVAALDPVWRNQLEPLADRLVATKPPLDELGRKLGGVAAQVNDAATKLGKAIGVQGLEVDQSNQVLPTRSVCIPLPGRDC